MFQNLQEAEATLKMLALYYNNSLSTNQQQVIANVDKFNDIHAQLFGLVKVTFAHRRRGCLIVYLGNHNEVAGQRDLITKKRPV